MITELLGSDRDEFLFRIEHAVVGSSILLYQLGAKVLH